MKVLDALQLSLTASRSFTAVVRVARMDTGWLAFTAEIGDIQVYGSAPNADGVIVAVSRAWVDLIERACEVEKC